MSNEVLFLNTIAEIRQRLKKGSEYDITKLSGLLRMLLLDKNNLLHKVNYKRIKFKFKVALRHPTVGKNITDFHSIIPNKHYPTEEINLKQLLSKKILSHRGYTFSVKEFILYTANQRGGVHVGETKDKKRKALEGIVKSGLKLKYKNTKSLDIGLIVFYDIAEVVLSGLSELIQSLSIPPNISVTRSTFE